MSVAPSRDVLETLQSPPALSAGWFSALPPADICSTSWSLVKGADFSADLLVAELGWVEKAHTQRLVTGTWGRHYTSFQPQNSCHSKLSLEYVSLWKVMTQISQSTSFCFNVAKTSTNRFHRRGKEALLGSLPLSTDTPLLSIEVPCKGSVLIEASGVCVLVFWNRDIWSLQHHGKSPAFECLYEHEPCNSSLWGGVS